MSNVIMHFIDSTIDDNPLIGNIELTESQSIGMLGSLKRLYETGRVRFTEEGYLYRGVLLKLNENVGQLNG